MISLSRRFTSARLASGHTKRLSPTVVLLAAALYAVASPATASTPSPPGPVLTLATLANTTAAPGSQFSYLLELDNRGTTDSSGQQYVVEGDLPSGLTADHVDSIGDVTFSACDDGAGGPVLGASHFRCTGSGVLGTSPPIGLRARLVVNVDPSASGAKLARFRAYGAGATLVDASPCASAATPPPALPVCASTVDPTTLAAAPLPFALDVFDGQVGADPLGSPYTQAAGTPYSASTAFDVTTQEDARADQTLGSGAGIATPTESTKDVLVHLPPGLVGNPSGLPRCAAADLRSIVQDNGGAQYNPHCPAASQVGTTEVRTNFGFVSHLVVPLYNMVAPANVPARFGFNVAGVDVLLDAHVRSGSDYGIDIASRDISQGVLVAGTSVSLWGVPSDPSHDRERACPDAVSASSDAWGCTSSAPPASFLRLPTSCQGPLTTTLEADSWQNPGAQSPDGAPLLSDPNWKQASFVSHNPPAYPNPPSDWGPPQGVTGCGQVPFNPQIAVQPTSHAADSPTGLDVHLTLPQTDDPNVLAEADLKKAVVDLPAGMSVNPSAADGLGACTSAQANLNSDGPANCPDNAKVGTVQVTTPLLPDPLSGSVYLAKQSDNPFSSLLAIYIVASGQGVNLKLPGKIDPDPSTGQLRAVFDNQPQLPFSDLDLHFFSGDRASLTTPPTCGTKGVSAALSSWAQPNAPVQRSNSFEITSGPSGSPCPVDAAHRPLAPQMSAGATDPTAGKYSPFVLRLQRQPGEQELTSLQADLPPGVLGKLAGVAQCSDATLSSIPTDIGTGQAEIDNPSCPPGSQVGHAQIGAGSGAPFYVSTSKVYLAGPYKGAPLSLAVVSPVVAGPFDLGNDVVRTALQIDRDDAQIHAVSDPIPTILHGIPLDIRDLRVVLDRPDFTLNPTNCSVMSVTGSVGGAGGVLADGSDDTSAPVSDRFQVGGCGGLGFSPRLSGAILNGTQGIHRSDHPNLAFTLAGNGGPGQANLASVAVTLPQAFQIDQANLGNICSETQLANEECAGRNTVGTAQATTPLLDTPLTGPVYAVSGSGGLPKLAVLLHGPPSMPIELVVRGITDTVGARIRNTFPLVPDAPVTDFTLSLKGGPGGYLVNNTNLCADQKKPKKKGRKAKGKVKLTSLASDVVFTGQNGDTLTTQAPLSAPCPKAKKHKKRRHARYKKH